MTDSEHLFSSPVLPALSIDARSCIIDGVRRLLLCGTIHYPRSTPDMWPQLMRHAKTGGLNCVETYVFWGLHEDEKGKYDFTGRLDVRRFCACAAAEGLKVFLRPGPYICAEQNYGGFPAWLRDVPGIRFRTKNEAYYGEVKRWFDQLFAHLQGCFSPQGGPIIALQVENEYANIGSAYGADGLAYMDWLRDLYASYHTEVPLTACNPAGDAAAMAALTPLAGAVPTLNSGFAHPFVRAFRHWAPAAPCLWTEAWMAWYQVWGLPRAWRPASDMAFCTARFFAEGGKGINYYVWHGGTNFGREGMYLQATQYEFDAALDEFGCPTTKYHVLRSLNRALAAHEAFLVENDLPEAVEILPGVGVRIFRQGGRRLEFLYNDGPLGTVQAETRWRGQEFRLPPRTVIMLLDGTEVWRAQGEETRDRPLRQRVETYALCATAWRACAEPIPQTGWLKTGRPIEQLAFTKNRSDYAWYSADISVGGATSICGKLRLKGINDFFQVFIDGVLVAVSRSDLLEDRGPWDGEDYQQEFALTITPGTHRIEILTGSLGMVKGDWQAGRRNMVEERKGFWGEAQWIGSDQVLFGAWSIHPLLVSETKLETGLAEWGPLEKNSLHRPLCWYETEFDTPAGSDPLLLDMYSLGKGLAWVNGNCLGRYWLIKSRVPDVIHTEHNQVMTFDAAGTPSQRYYHVPREWLRAGCNVLRIFEEIGGDPHAVRLMKWSEC